MLSVADIVSLTENPGRLDKSTFDELRQVVNAYPCFHAARLLLMENSICLNPEERDAVWLRKQFFHLPCSMSLDDFVKEILSMRDARYLAGDRTMSVLNEFLGDDTGLQDDIPFVQPVSTDYLLAAGIDSADESPETSDGDSLSAILDSISEITPSEAQACGEEPEEVQSGDDGEDDETDVTVPSLDGSMLTETLAAIYVRQHRYREAIEIIRSLCLTFPNKSSYFADQIRYLEKLIEVNKQKQK